MEYSTFKKRDNEVRWWVTRTNNSAAHLLRKEFTDAGVEWFQASCQRVRTIKGRRQKVTEYFMSDIFFLHTTIPIIQELRKRTVTKFNFYYNICAGRNNECVCVPDKQMEDFMRVASSYDFNPEVISVDNANLSKGDRIRIIGGQLDGVEGRFVQLKRGQRRKLIVQLDGFMAVTAEIDPGTIEKL